MLTRQEMFDKAVAGLKAQGWAKCADSGGTCMYQKDNLRCAWGHVDPSLTDQCGSVRDMKTRGLGLAAELAQDDLVFATYLQLAHDNAKSPGEMQHNFSNLANYWGLDNGYEVYT